jgi:hypothetical protein
MGRTKEQLKADKARKKEEALRMDAGWTNVKVILD